MAEQSYISVNHLANPLVDSLIDASAPLRIENSILDCGSRLIDAGVNCIGSIDAGIRIAEICMAGLGSVSLAVSSQFQHWPWNVMVTTSQPVLACLASQYAGWSLSVANDQQAYRAMASGPGRALADKEALFSDIGYRDTAESAVLVLESDRLPPSELAEQIAKDCSIEPASLTLIVTPTASLAGGVQIAARVVEVSLHKAHELGFSIEHIVDALGTTPLPPVASSMMSAMGRTNDTILYGGQVHLYVTGSDNNARDFAQALPSNNSRDYGKPFEQVFADYNHDFFKIDGSLFSPAQVAVTALESGKTYHAGELSEALIDRSFGFAQS